MSNSAPTSFLSSTLKSIAQNNLQCAAAVDAVTALALAAADIATVIRHPDKDAALSAERGSANVDGDEQKTLDVLADEMIQAALVEVLAHLDGLLDEAVEVLRDLRGEALLLEDAKDFAAGDVRDLRDAVRVPKDDADLRRRQALLRELSDVVDDLLGGDLEPRRGRPPVRQRGLRDALSAKTQSKDRQRSELR